MSDRKEQPTATASLEVRRIKAATRAKLFGETAAPPQISRYRVLRQLGVGGMGEVFLAHDDGLGRKVAIKLVRLDRESGVERASSRLMREAQALARLSHPNVVQVYEVGEYEGRVFIAMEFVHGVHMRRWLEGGERPWRQILELYAQAGAGLAAAHRVGLVHRDFKPENVLVGSDGRVRVVDFGLVRKAPDPDTGPGISEGASAEDLERSSRLTQSGALMGTPSYMSPEQFQGLRATEKSDQFAFCVALYRGLYGWHPFAAETRLELKRRVLSGQLAAPPRDAKVPHGIFQVLERGLAVDPERRYPSMEALLAALAAPPSHRRVGLIASTAAAALAGGLVAWFTWPADTASPGPLSATWDKTRRAAVAAAFHATGAPYAAAAADYVTATLDRRAAELADALAAAPPAVPALAERRAACLERRERRITALVDALEHADVSLVERAPELVDALPTPEPCGDLERLAAGPPPPASGQAEGVLAAAQALHHARVLVLRRRWDDATREGERAVQLARDAGACAEHAEALALVGHIWVERRAHDRATEQLDAALERAEACHHDELQRDLWLDLAELERRRPNAAENAHFRARRAAAAAARAGDAVGVSQADQLRAATMRALGRVRDAERLFLAAAAQARDRPLLSARIELELADLLIEAGRAAEAAAPLTHACELLRRFTGHPLLTAAEAELAALSRPRAP